MKTSYFYEETQEEINHLDFSKDILTEIHRGADDNIEEMFGGSFYTKDIELACTYAYMNDTQCLYTFSLKGLKMLLVDNNEDIDDGVELYDEETINAYDGVMMRNGVQVLMFGRFSCKDGSFKKMNYSDIVIESKGKHRKFNR